MCLLIFISSMIYIKKNIINEIINTIGKNKIELGGILGLKDNCIVSFYFDKKLIYKKQYIPNVIKINKIIKKWYKEDIMFIGFIHSHANGYNKPSKDDYIYAKKLIDTNKFLEYLIFPIVTIIDNEIKIDYYKFTDDFEKIVVEEIE